jgi:hypothetical protein
VKELNGLESRRGRKPLDINNVVYWFKNARAAQKRAELRGVGPGEFTHLPPLVWAVISCNKDDRSPLRTMSAIYHDNVIADTFTV